MGMHFIQDDDTEVAQHSGMTNTGSLEKLL